MKTWKSLVLVGLMLASVTLRANETTAQDQSLNPDFSVGSVEVTEVQVDEADKLAYSLPEIDSSLGSIISISDKLIALGTKIWDIVKANRPVVTTNFAPAISVLPRGVTDSNSFETMYGWSEPVVRQYVVSVKNLYGIEVVNFKYAVIMQYAGLDANGRGKYITGLTVAASDLTVKWGWNFDANSSLVSIANKGTPTQPVASANLKISYKISTPLNEMQSSVIFHVDGRGKMLPLN